MTPLLQATGLGLAGRLAPTSFALRAGELTCLIGPNGSGKTSLLHAIAGIGAPAGTVLVGGVDPRTLGPEQRRRLFAYLPASRDVKWPLTAYDLIALGVPAGQGTEIDQVLADLELCPFRDRKIDQLSTGERTRVLIARALAGKPRLLLLDEPAANLDPLWQLRLMDHLQGMAQRNGQALLVAMHDLELTRLYADRLIIMHRGRIEADGEPERLLSGAHIPRIFGIQRSEGRWRPVA